MIPQIFFDEFGDTFVIILQFIVYLFYIKKGGCNVDANIRYVHRTLNRILQLHVVSHCIFGTACSKYSTT